MDVPAAPPAVEVVDLRRSGEEEASTVAMPPPRPKRRGILVGVLLVVVGAVVGWLVASPSDPTDSLSAPEPSAPVASTPPAAAQDPPSQRQLPKPSTRSRGPSLPQNNNLVLTASSPCRPA
jgi:hypothetical protein